jgi:arsenate reductase
MPETPIRVLFICTGNSARSQMAEAILGQLGGSAFEVASAGTAPKGVNPLTIRALSEREIDWTRAVSKGLEGFLDQEWDYVVTVCDRARQACPVFPGVAAMLHWDLADPAEVEGSDEERLAAFRTTAEDLARRLHEFTDEALRAAGRVRGVPSV